MKTDADPRAQALRKLGIGCLCAIGASTLLVIGVEWQKRHNAHRHQEFLNQMEQDRGQRETWTPEFNRAFADQTPPDLEQIETEALSRGEASPLDALPDPDLLRRSLGKVAVLRNGAPEDRLSELHFALPTQLRATTPEEVDTICWTVGVEDGMEWHNVSAVFSFEAILVDRHTSEIIGFEQFHWTVPMGEAMVDPSNPLNTWLRQISDLSP